MNDQLNRATQAVDLAMDNHKDTSKKQRQLTKDYLAALNRKLADLKLQRRDLDLTIQDVQSTINANERMLELLPVDQDDRESFRPAGAPKLPQASTSLMNADNKEKAAA